MEGILSLDAFVEDYAVKNQMSLGSARTIVWANGDYTKYLTEMRKKYDIKTCYDCGGSYDVQKYYCGDMGCGKGSWCRKNKYKLCKDCANDRIEFSYE